MSNNKQSSVEWYANEEDKLFTSYQKGFMSTARYILLKYKLREQAKAMHKEEHGQTWDKSLDNLKARGMNEMRAYTDFDEYYNETFEDESN